MKIFKLTPTFFLVTSLFSISLPSIAAIGDKVIMIGSVTRDYTAKGYVSFKDNFQQTFIFPKKYLETVHKKIIDPTESKTYLFEISDKDYTKLFEDCSKTFKNDPAMIKMCPVKI